VRPGETVELLVFDEPQGLRFEVRVGERPVASGRWDAPAP